MSNLIELGKDGKQSIQLDLKQLIASRAIIQARSGAGKSWFLRRLLEQTYGHVQQIVIDPEGEFYTLREKFDYVLAGKGHDVHPQTQHAGDFGRKILELGVSCIFDLYEYEDWEKTRFVKLLLKGLHDAPKNLRHPVLVVIDEAQMFMPEEGSAESSQAMINLCSQGRKRGLCAILATQRIAMVKKSATANLGNKLIGSTFQDIDQVRAGKELGFVKQDYIKLRDLKPGNFHGYGQAIRIDGKDTNGIVTFKAGGIQTKHPEPGEDVKFTPAAPTQKAVKALQELSKLPAKLAEEAKTLEDIRKDNAELKRRLAAADKGTGPSTAQLTELKREIAQWKAKCLSIQKESRKTIESIDRSLAGVSAKQGDLQKAIKSVEVMVSAEVSKIPEPINIDADFKLEPLTRKRLDRLMPIKPLKAPDQVPLPRPTAGELPEGIGKSHKRILDAIASLEAAGIQSPPRATVAARAGYAQSGTFDNYVSQLRSAALIDYRDGGIVTTDNGRSIADVGSSIDTLESLHEFFLAWCNGRQREMLKFLIERYPHAVTRAELAEAVGMAQSGTFDNYVSELSTKCVVGYPQKGMVKASDLLFPEGLS